LDPIQTTTDPVDPQEAIEFFRRKSTLTEDQFKSLSEQNHAKAFTLAGVADIDVLVAAYDSLDSALAEGTSFADWKSEIGEQLEASWGGTVANPGARLETIFRTSLQSSYMAGRHAQAMEGKEDRMYGMLDVVEDSSTSEICGDLDDAIGGQALEIDDPALQAAWPPNHFNCRSQIITLTEAEAREMGINDDPPSPEDLEIDDDFRGPPDSYTPDPEDYPDGFQDAVKNFLAD
jgi:SPP1 gp7 family putative phage head morphogenesis protein